MRRIAVLLVSGVAAMAAGASATAGNHGEGGAGQDAGPTVRFGEPVRVSPAGRLAMSADLAVDSDGNAHLIWVDKGADGKAEIGPQDPEHIESGKGVQHHAFDDLYYRSVRADTAALSEPVMVNGEPGEVWGFSVSKPQVAVAPNGDTHVLFTGNIDLGGGKSSVIARYTRSTDGGKSFEPVRTLNRTADNDLSAVMHGGFVAAHAFGTIHAARNGNVMAYWIDTRLMSEEDEAGAIFQAVSTDGGKSFEVDEAVLEERVCPCCQLAAAENDDALFLASRRTYDGGFRDTTVAVSDEDESRFDEPVKVGEERWKINGCPLKRTDVAASGKHVFTAGYTRGREPGGVYLSRSKDGGQSYPEAMLVHPDARIADAPSVSADPRGNVYVAWHAKTEGPRRVYLRVSRDAGENWSEVIEMPAPEGTAAYPEIAAAPDGTAWLTWQQDNAIWLQSVALAKPQLAAGARAR